MCCGEVVASNLCFANHSMCDHGRTNFLIWETECEMKVLQDFELIPTEHLTKRESFQLQNLFSHRRHPPTKLALDWGSIFDVASLFNWK